MNNEQILKKAISKAIKNGWNPIDDMGEIDNFKVVGTGGNWVGIWINFKTKLGDGGQLDITRMLFAHSFPKALWKCDCDEGNVCLGHHEETDEYEWGACDKCVDTNRTPAYIPIWQYHQHEMLGYVQEGKNPLKYLEKFISQGSIR